MNQNEGTVVMKSKQIFKRVQEIIAQDADHCSLCGTAFPHLSTSCYGEIDGKVEIVGACCSAKMKRCFGGSAYLNTLYLKRSGEKAN
jgi:hypothetical protein